MASFFDKLKEKFSAKEELNTELISLDEYEEFVESQFVTEKLVHIEKLMKNFLRI